MFEDGVPAQWLKRARWVVYSFFTAFAIAGVVYIFYAAVDGRVLHALIGAGVTWGSIGLGIAMHCVIQLAAVVDRNLRAQDDLRQRFDALEQLVSELAPIVNLPDPDVNRGDLNRSAAYAPDPVEPVMHVPKSLIAATLEEDTYPRLAPRLASSKIPAVSDDSVEFAPALRTDDEFENECGIECEDERENTVDSFDTRAINDKAINDKTINDKTIDDDPPESTESAAIYEGPSSGAAPPPTLAALRTRFRDAVHAADFGAAIDAGETIVEYYPDSACAYQFDQLRTPLYDRQGHNGHHTRKSTPQPEHV
jgi:hypothetical protein